jgi:autotransporter-associated beta strand protein
LTAEVFIFTFRGRNWDSQGFFGSNPDPGDDLVFAGSTRTTPNNNYVAGTTFGSLSFANGASAFTLTGNSITLTNGVTNNGANNQTINMALILPSGPHTFATASTGSLAVGGVVSGSGGITKTGAQTLTLSGANSYSGATTVSGGTLRVTGSIGNSAVTVSGAGSVLASGVSGTVGNSVSLGSGTTLAAGGKGAVGTATVTNNVGFSSGSIFDWDVSSASSFDKVTAGSLSGGDAIFNVVTDIGTNFWDVNRTFSNVFTAASGLAQNVFASFQLSGTGLSGGLVAGRGTFALSGNDLTWSAVPEPTSALVGLMLAAGLLRRRRG